MPTGYTAGIADGSVTSFAEYATECMREFGACVTLRDEPSGIDIPEFTPSDLYANALQKAKDDLDAINDLTDEQVAAACESEFTNKTTWHERIDLEKNAEKERYERMLSFAKQLLPPTAEHVEWSKFLVTQLEESIKFECYDREEYRPKKLTPEQWKQSKLVALTHSIAYHTKKHAEEIERTNQRNEWVKAARKAIAEVESRQLVESSTR